MTPGSSESSRGSRIRSSIERIKAWMKAHDASVLVENLAPGASPQQIEKVESELGYSLPADLRALWSVNAGQRNEQDGFVGAMDMLGPEAAIAELESVAMFLGVLREHPTDWTEAGTEKIEVDSNRWLAFAGRGYADMLVVSGESGRVFTCGKDAPPLHLVATSILDWVEAYADRVEAGGYEIEKGFGECYLARGEAMY
jgi:cell wall assembly regulator SMI1